MPITDKLNKVSNGSQPLPAQLSAPKSAGATSASLSSATGWDTTTAKHIRMYQTQVVNGQTVPNQSTICYYKATLSGTTLSNLQLIWSATGADQDYPSGATVDLSLTAGWADDLIDSVSTQHNHDGTHKAITGPSAVFSGTVTASNFIQSGGAGAEGWTLGLPTPNTVTYNGNRSYDLVFNGDDITDTVSPGMRLRTTRTVTAPTQCTSLNGTSQYYSKAAPAGMTFTDDFTTSAWIKLSSYANGSIVSRFNGSSGWDFNVTTSGQVSLNGLNAGNVDTVTSYQSIPLNKWIHVAATLDMSGSTGTVYFDGVLVPSTYTNSAATSLVQAGNLEVGGRNGGTLPLPGKIAQAAVFSTVLSASTIRGYISQGLSGSETNLISAYSFNNSINDLNTTNANNLTASGAAVATNADSPFSVNGFGTATGTTDYAIIQKATFSTNTTLTVQVPEGNTIPTSGGVSAVAYSSQKAPYGIPTEREKWQIQTIHLARGTQSGVTSGVAYNVNSFCITIPTGKWTAKYSVPVYGSSTTAGENHVETDLNTTAATVDTKSPFSALANWGINGTVTAASATKEHTVSLTSAAIYYFNFKTTSSTTANGLLLLADIAQASLTAENAYL